MTPMDRFCFRNKNGTKHDTIQIIYNKAAQKINLRNFFTSFIKNCQICTILEIILIGRTPEIHYYHFQNDTKKYEEFNFFC